MADLVLLSDDEQLKQKFQSAVTPFVSENEVRLKSLFIVMIFYYAVLFISEYTNDPLIISTLYLILPIIC